MDEKVLSALRDLEEMEQRPDLEEPLWRISEDNGRFHNMLIRMTGAKRILEVGSSSGYSGIFLAEAARANGGTLTTCEFSRFKIQLARSSYEKAGLADVVTLIEGDAKQSVRDLAGPWDFVFLDAFKDDYKEYLQAIWDKIVPGGVITADDVISQGNTAGIQSYLGYVKSLPDAESVTVPIDDGVEMTYKR